MSESYTPFITISLTGRMSITRDTLSYLSNPTYIQFLINPHKKQIAIRQTVKNDKSAFRIKYCSSHNTAAEIPAKELVTKIIRVFHLSNEEPTVQIPGKYIPKENLLLFTVSNSKE